MKKGSINKVRTSNKKVNIIKEVAKSEPKKDKKKVNQNNIKRNNSYNTQNNKIKQKRIVDKTKDERMRNISSVKKDFSQQEITEVSKEEIKRKPISKKKRRRLLYTFLTLGMVLAICYLTLNLSTFDLKSINVNGNLKYTNGEIISNSKFKINENIFIQYFKYKNLPLNDLPYVESTNVDLVFPNEININVVERKAIYVAFDKEKNKYFKLDKLGYILEETAKEKREENEILVYGITFNNKVILGEKINEIDYDKLKVFEKIAEEYKKSEIGDNITKVNFENSLTTITLNDKLNVMLPNDTNLKYNLDLLKSILKKNGDLQGVIDMTKTDPIFSIY